MNTLADLDELYPAHLLTLTTRLASALSACDFDSLVIHSGQARIAFLDDQRYPFRINPHFKWWLPLQDAPGCLLHLTPGNRPLLLFHSAADYWHKPAALPRGSWSRHFDIEFCPDDASLRSALPPPGARTAFIGEPTPRLAALGFGAVNPQPLLDRLHEHRVRKTPYELACLRAASSLGVAGQQAARAAFEHGASEFAIHQAFLSGCGLREQELPYQAIVALNANAATLHYQDLERAAPRERRTLLIDAGAQYNGYASDITRTHVAHNGTFAGLLAGMEDLQLTLCDAVRAGLDWRDLHLSAHHLVAELLRDAGLIRLDPAHAVDSGLSGVFLPHGLGHLLGLQVHDVAGFKPGPEQEPIPPPLGHETLRLTRVLEPGFVITMEPGLYFIEMLLERAKAGPLARFVDWALADSLKPYGGIRIEDNLAVTDQGHENLTRNAFARLAAAEASP